jgi:hypothetical protein
MVSNRSTPEVPQELAGKWIAWDRDQTKIVGWGDSFESVKRAAAQAGQREVLIAKSQPKSRWLRSQHLLCMVAVFISQAADTFGDFSDFGL